ncbi:MAG: maleylpyruvate isomerase family mycothiol-dependent enzyme [Arthrobacter sp.]|uniref:maleylpyruvate isomerase family mycothiol-dependent enzyme n=1 Tax=Arthrobacter sp. TaxID=1667 RepID=UPI003489D39F
MTTLSPPALTAFVREAVDGLRSAIGSLEGAAMAEPSALPGWTRAHVVAHVDGVSRAIARQLEHARRGTRVGFYDGGMEGRNERIALGALMAPAKLAERALEGLDLLERALGDVPDDGWDALTSFRGEGTVRDCVLGAWREALIHTADLGLGAGPVDWPSEFSRHLFDFLSVRLPAGTRVVLQPTGRPPVVLGTGRDSTVITGMEFDLAAWIAGREPSGPIRATASADASELPALGPWPSAVPASA